MNTPQEAKYRRVWEQLQSFQDDDLYVMLAGPIVDVDAEIGPDGLSTHFIFERTAEAVRNGKKRLEAVLLVTRKELCRSWESTKVYRDPFELFVHVSELLKSLLASEPLSPVGAIAILICRGCDFSLEKLCTASKAGPS